MTAEALPEELDFAFAPESLPKRERPTLADAASRRARSGGGRPVVYRLPNGKRVPSVTTITKRFAESGGLIRWAYLQGLDGKDMDETRDRAGDIGGACHDAVEAFVTGGTECEARQVLDRLEDEEDRAKAGLGFDGFMAWWKAYRPEIVATEQPLVDEELEFGGTLDAAGRIAGLNCIIDWKSSNKLHADFLTQVIGYGRLWHRGVWNVAGEWRRVGGTEIGGYHILRFAKASGGFEHRFFPAARMGPVMEHLANCLRTYKSDRAVADLLK